MASGAPRSHNPRPMRLVLLSGSSHPALAKEVAQELGTTLGTCHIEKYPDGELDIEVRDDLRHAHVFLLQTLHAPVGEHLLELSLIADACHRAGAPKVTAVIPYLGYARQDRRESETEPLGARVVAQMLGAGPIDHVVCLDLHSRAVEGCFSVPVEHASAITSLVDHVRERIPANSVVVSPDLGAVKRAELFARPLGLPVAVVHKHRLSGESVEARGLVGDVKGKHAILCDDMISTGGTTVAAVQALLDAGVQPRVTVVAAHGLFAGPAYERFKALPLERVVVSDSVPLLGHPPFPLERVRCAPRLAAIVNHLNGHEH